MALDDFKQGLVNYKQVKVDLTDKVEKTLVAAVSGKRIKIFRMVVSANDKAKIIFRSASTELMELYSGSDCMNIEMQSTDVRWPVLLGEIHSDVNFYQSDLAAIGASCYAQYRYE